MVPTKEFDENQVKIERGKLIRNRRKVLGLTQRQLAAMISPDLSGSSVGQWENGETSPRLRYQQAVAKALELSWAELFALDEDVA